MSRTRVEPITICISLAQPTQHRTSDPGDSCHSSQPSELTHSSAGAGGGSGQPVPGETRDHHHHPRGTCQSASRLCHARGRKAEGTVGALSATCAQSCIHRQAATAVGLPGTVHYCSSVSGGPWEYSTWLLGSQPRLPAGQHRHIGSMRPPHNRIHAVCYAAWAGSC